jgi:predicted amidohydrolase YtcJ
VHIIYNANIFTQEPDRPLASAMIIDNGRIVATGEDSAMTGAAPANAHKTNLNGKVIWPGLIDAHIHLETYAASLQFVDCETETRQECLDRVAERAKKTPEGAWIRGHGWNQNNWPEGFGDAHDLDQAAAAQPVYLTAKSLHAAWANSLALQKAGISAATPDPQSGKIVRDGAGQPTGILLEAAMELVEKVIPNASHLEISQQILEAQTQLWKMGITGVHDYDPVSCFSALQILQEQGKLHLRVVKGVPQEAMPHAIATGLRTGYGNEFLRIGSVKLFADGALGPRTAAMLAPYENETEYSGFPFLDAEQVYEIGQDAVRNGLSLATHAIGDRANHEVINAYAQLRAFETNQNLPHLRHRIEHVQLLHPNDINRLAQYQIIASMQPIHAPSDMRMADRHWGERSAYAYAWNSLLRNKTLLTFGSDAPVESPNPFWGIYSAVTRQRLDGQPGSQGWYPEQRITLQEALAAYTLGPAFAAGNENCQGKLAAGYYADFIVLDRDPFSIPAVDLAALQPKATMVAGEWVWQS